MSIISTIVGTGRKIGTAIYPHLPTIALVGGSVAVCGGAFLACKATLKADQILDEHRGMMEHVYEAEKKLPKDEYTAKDIKKDKLQVYSATAGKFFKLYGPAVALGVAGFASIFAGFGLIHKWHAMAVSAVGALDQKFTAYRQNVVNEYGVEADRKMLGVPETKKIDVKSVDEEGNETTVEANVIDVDAIEDDFTWIFDSTSPKWDDGYLYNDNKIYEVQNWYTKHLQNRSMDHVFLNTVGKEFGKPESGVGHFFGWTDKPGCNVFLSAQPFIRMWNAVDDEQFPMMEILPVAYDELGRYFFINEADEDRWKEAYANDENSVGYILHFNVDTDANGIPCSIYEQVYGKKDRQLVA